MEIQRKPFDAVAPGPVAIFGSGETSASGRRVYEWLFRRSSPPVRVSVLETPAGFQPNSAQVAGKVGDFLRRHLQNHRPVIDIVPARRRGDHLGTDDEGILSPVLSADMIFLGPGSPTYAVRHLQGSIAWHTIQACHRQGASLVLASSAAIAAGARALPVYEIYKAGEDLHWRDGLDLFGPYGLSLVFVSHWNNTEGGSELDTSRCYMGAARFHRLLEMLPPDLTVVGVDEHTALLLDPAEENCRVMGRGGVTLLRSGQEDMFGSGQTFPITELGRLRSIDPRSGVPVGIWARVAEARHRSPDAAVSEPPPEVLSLVEAREKARSSADWKASDALREQIRVSGWRIEDTPGGPQLTPTCDAAE
ncbi:MAG: cysteinyl-tRNA synthetase [Dehalococcoidia bacterium]